MSQVAMAVGAMAACLKMKPFDEMIMMQGVMDWGLLWGFVCMGRVIGNKELGRFIIMVALFAPSRELSRPQSSRNSHGSVVRPSGGVEPATTIKME